MKRILKKVARELKRPLKRLEKKIRASAQRFVLRTIERNPERVYQAIVAFAPQILATKGESPAPPVTDAMLIAFLRSSQRKNRRLAGASRDPQLSSASPSLGAVAVAESLQESVNV